MREKDLVLVSRLQYENLLKHLETNEADEQLWKSDAKAHFFKSYSKSDEIYDQI